MIVPLWRRLFSDEDIVAYRKSLDSRISLMETYRWSWWQHWRLLNRYIQPRLGRFLSVPNPGSRGAPKNQQIINSTGTLAAQRFGAGMFSGTCNPARPWFKLRIGNGNAKESPGVRAWLDEVTDRMMHVFAESNFYEAVAAVLENIGTFGTGAMIGYEDFDNVVYWEPQTTGEYYLAINQRNEVDTFARKRVMTVAEIVDRFGIDSVSPTVKTLYQTDQLIREVTVCCVIEPNDDRVSGTKPIKGMKYREVYWEWGQAQNTALSIRGFHEKPFAAPRWNVTSNDPYGRSCGMDALGDIIQIQVQEKRKAQAIAKMVNPPMVGDALLRNHPASLVPGGVTFLPPGSQAGFKPAYEVKPDIGALAADIQLAEQRVKSAFFQDLFLMISQMEGVQPRNQLEIAARKEEKMTMLGPPLIKLNRELLGAAIERTFGIMSRVRFPNGKSMIPDPPAGISGHEIGVEFVSILAQAQKASNTAAIERTFQFAGGISAVKPEVLDNLDADQAIKDYADDVGAPSNIIVADDKVQQIREGRAQQQRMATALQTGMAAATGAKTLSETDVGGGVNALQRMTGNG